MARNTEVRPEDYIDLENAEELESSGEFELLPLRTEDGESIVYQMVVSKPEVAESKNGVSYVKYAAQVLSPKEYAGRLVFEVLAFTSDDPGKAKQTLGMTKARIRGITGEAPDFKGKLASVCSQVAKTISGRKFEATLRIETGKGGYSDKNRIGKIITNE